VAPLWEKISVHYVSCTVGRKHATETSLARSAVVMAPAQFFDCQYYVTQTARIGNFSEGDWVKMGKFTGEPNAIPFSASYA